MDVHRSSGSTLNVGLLWEVIKMAQFYVTNESSEDTFGATDDLHEAIRIAKEVAQTGQVGDLVLVESAEGKGVRQFVRNPDGTIEEKPVG